MKFLTILIKVLFIISPFCKEKFPKINNSSELLFQLLEYIWTSSLCEPFEDKVLLLGNFFMQNRQILSRTFIKIVKNFNFNTTKFNSIITRMFTSNWTFNKFQKISTQNTYFIRTIISVFRAFINVSNFLRIFVLSRNFLFSIQDIY